MQVSRYFLIIGLLLQRHHHSAFLDLRREGLLQILLDGSPGLELPHTPVCFDKRDAPLTDPDQKLGSWLLHFLKGSVGFPEQYYVQCVHYLAVTGWDRWYLAVLVLGREFLHYTLERDQAEIDALMGAERDFWLLVENDTPPGMDGNELTSSALREVYEATDRGDVVDLQEREMLLLEYRRLLAVRTENERRIRQIKQTLMQDLGGAEEGRCGNFRVGWKPQKRVFLSAEKLRKVYPRLDLSKVMSVAKYRRFSVQEENGHATD